MFTSFMAWLSNLSVAGKVVIAVLGASAAGSMVISGQEQTPTPTHAEVKAEKDVSSPEKTIETVREDEAIPYGKQTIETSTLNEGVSQITSEGVNGVKTKTYRVTKSNGSVVSKELLKTEVTTTPIDEVTSVGTYVAPRQSHNPQSICDPNYSPCVPSVSYDLDCPDVGFSVSVVGSDPHRFDRDGDGYGCEAY